MNRNPLFDDIYNPVKNYIDQYFLSRKSLNGLPKIEKWFIYSDYYLNDDKTNFVFSYFVRVGVLPITEEMQTIKSLARGKISNTKSPNPLFFNYINSVPGFSLSFVFAPSCKKNLFWNDSVEKATFLRESVDHLLNLKLGHEFSGKLLKLRRKLSKNTALPAQLVVNDLFVYVIIRYINETFGADVVTWFSDRDSMTSYCDSIYKEFLSLFLSENRIKIRMNHAISKENSEWYSELIKIPDYVCGLLSSIDFEKGQLKAAKHLTTLNNLAAENPNFIPIVYQRDEAGMTISHASFKKSVTADN